MDNLRQFTGKYLDLSQIRDFFENKMKTLKTPIEQRAGLLSAQGLFSPLSPAEAKILARSVMHRAYEKSELLFAQAQPAEGFFVVLKGRVAVFRTGPEGKTQILHVLSDGEFLGEVPVFQGRNYPASAKAQTRTEVLYIPGDAFLDFAQNNPGVLIEMLAEMSLRLRGFVELIDDLSLKEVSARLAKYLLDCSVRAKKDTFTLDISKAALASRLGTIPATLSRTMNKMQNKGYIRVNNKVISILNTDNMVLAACGEKI